MVSVLDSSVIDHALQTNCIGVIDRKTHRPECDRSWVTEKLHRWCNG